MKIQYYPIILISLFISSSFKFRLVFEISLKGGVGGGLAHFFGTFSRGASLVNKRVYFFQSANDLNFLLFLGCIYIT